MKNTTNRQASVDSRRVSLEREIAIRVPRFDTFVTEYSQNISTTGMFIVSDKPQPPGTTFSFEFSVADDWKLRTKGPKGHPEWASAFSR
jgi:xylose isomerase